MHKYKVTNGAEVTTGGWPEVIALKPDIEKGITFLTYATDTGGISYLYMGTSGYGDSSNDASGHLTSINLSTGAQKVFDTMCSDQTVDFVKSPGTPRCATGHGAIWGRSTVLYSPGTNRVYGTTGDGTFDPATHFWGDTVVALTPDGAGTGSGGNPLDSDTPASFAYLQSADYDLGASSPSLCPTAAASTQIWRCRPGKTTRYA